MSKSMFVDARTLPGGITLDADVCIIGGGAAGIVLARDLAGGGRNINLFESGGFNFDEKTQDLYAGETAGQPLQPLTAERLRFFGGSTNHWSGGCRPFDDQDFEAYPYIACSGWPIRLKDLADFYRRAHVICQLGAYTYDARDWATGAIVPLPFGDDSTLRTGMNQYSPPTRFGEVYRQDLATAAGVTVYLHANVVDIEANESASQVTGLRLACLDGGRQFRARAKVYVLATGGIENPRLLLSANAVQKGGLGNGNDLVGRYFMDHPYIPNAATLILSKPNPSLAFYQARAVRATTVQGYLHPTAEIRRRQELPSFGIAFSPGSLPEVSGVKESLWSMYQAVAAGRWPDHLGDHVALVLRKVESEAQDKYYRWLDSKPLLYSINYSCECPPDRDSRVTLDDNIDALGMRQVRVDWRLPGDFERSLHRGLGLLAQELGRTGIGRLRINPLLSGPSGFQGVENGHHHMGTTRMHDDPRQGVVDANCRVHGISNLFVGGSSVFPTYSFDNPTMTIVALTLRLSAYLKSNDLTQMSPPGITR
jgi:choline dehydrogenase-like flavoprotein